MCLLSVPLENNALECQSSSKLVFQILRPESTLSKNEWIIIEWRTIVVRLRTPTITSLIMSNAYKAVLIPLIPKLDGYIFRGSLNSPTGQLYVIGTFLIIFLEWKVSLSALTLLYKYIPMLLYINLYFHTIYSAYYMYYLLHSWLLWLLLLTVVLSAHLSEIIVWIRLLHCYVQHWDI